MLTSKEWTDLLETENSPTLAKQIRAIAKDSSHEEILKQIRDLMHAWDKYYPFTRKTDISKRIIGELLKLNDKDPSLKPDIYFNVAQICSRKLATEASINDDDYKAGTYEGIALTYLKMAADLSKGSLYGDKKYTTHKNLFDQHKRRLISEAKDLPSPECSEFSRGILDGITITAAIYAPRTVELIEFRDEYADTLQKRGIQCAPNSKVSKVLRDSSPKNDKKFVTQKLDFPFTKDKDHE